MRKGDNVELKMKKVLSMSGILDEHIQICNLLKYDEKQECLYFILQFGELTDLSLDAIYDCAIKSAEEQISCTGRIKERYQGEEGKTVKFEIENGFYKINLKSVDK